MGPGHTASRGGVRSSASPLTRWEGDEQQGGPHARQWRDLIYVLTKGLWLGTATQVRTEAVEMEAKRRVGGRFGGGMSKLG